MSDVEKIKGEVVKNILQIPTDDRPQVWREIKNKLRICKILEGIEELLDKEIAFHTDLRGIEIKIHYASEAWTNFELDKKYVEEKV